MSQAQLGLDCKLYRLSTGTRATWGAVGADTFTHEATTAPTGLDEVPNVKDLTLPLTKGEADTSTRGAAGWKTSLGTLKDGSIDFAMVYDSADLDQAAFLKAFMKNTNIACAILSGDKATVGSEGLWADFQVMKFERTEGLEEAVMINVSIKPAYSAVAPEWVKTTAAP